MFGSYKFGNISKGVYNAVTSTDSTNVPSEQKTESMNPPKKQTKQKQGYQFGDLTKSAYNTTKTYYNDYQFGDVSTAAYRSVSGQTVPQFIKITNPIKEGFLQQKSALLLTYRKFWAVLQGTFLYLFKGEKQYNQCINAFDLTAYCGVQRDSSSYKGVFDLVSANDSQRFMALNTGQRNAWIQSITKAIGAHKLDEMKQVIIEKEDTQDAMTVNVECVAYYIVDLEFSHQENGDPQTLLRNQNFIISSIIWSYIHETDKQSNMSLVKDLNEDQRTSLKYWQQPIAVAHGMLGGLEGAVLGQVIGLGGGLTGFFGLGGDFTLAEVRGHKINVPRPVILPLSLVAGAVIGTAYFTPVLAEEGFKYSYNQAKK